MVFDSHGEIDLRATIVDKELKGFAERLYKIKNYMNVSRTGAWVNSFFRASPDTLTAGTTRDVRGIARGAAFPQASTSFEKIRTDIEQYGLEDSIAWADIIAGEVAVKEQTLMRIAEGIVYSVDRTIWDALYQEGAANSFSITAGYEWDTASADILDNLERAEQLIGTNHYPTENMVVFVSLRDKRAIMKYILNQGGNIPSIADGAVRAGVVGTLGNKTFVVSDVVTASYSVVMVPKRNTWKELTPLTTNVENKPGKNALISAWEFGVVQITDPKAICIIKNTQSANA